MDRVFDFEVRKEHLDWARLSREQRTKAITSEGRHPLSAECPMALAFHERTGLLCFFGSIDVWLGVSGFDRYRLPLEIKQQVESFDLYNTVNLGMYKIEISDATKIPRLRT